MIKGRKVGTLVQHCVADVVDVQKRAKTPCHPASINACAQNRKQSGLAAALLQGTTARSFVNLPPHPRESIARSKSPLPGSWCPWSTLFVTPDLSLVPRSPILVHLSEWPRQTPFGDKQSPFKVNRLGSVLFVHWPKTRLFWKIGQRGRQEFSMPDYIENMRVVQKDRIGFR